MVDQPPKPEGDEPAPSGASKPQSFLHNLAQRSAGLSDQPAKGDSDAQQKESSQLLRLGGMGVQIAGTLIVFLLIGHWIDKACGWNYIATITAAAVALIGSLYLLIKEALRLNK